MVNSHWKLHCLFLPSGHLSYPNAKLIWVEWVRSFLWFHHLSKILFSMCERLLILIFIISELCVCFFIANFSQCLPATSSVEKEKYNKNRVFSEFYRKRIYLKIIEWIGGNSSSILQSYDNKIFTVNVKRGGEMSDQ